MSEQKKPKFKVGNTVVVIKEYSDGDNFNFEEGHIHIGGEYVISEMWEGGFGWCAGEYVYILADTEATVSESMLTLASDYYASKEQQMNISLDNTKINVAAYAEQYGITLEQAHNEIQPWLFSHLFTWANGEKTVSQEYAKHLYLDREYYGEPNRITWSNTSYQQSGNKEILLERNIILTIKAAPDIISFDGKKYIKKEFLKAIQNLSVVEC